VAATADGLAWLALAAVLKARKGAYDVTETDREAFATYYHGARPSLQVRIDKRTGVATTKEFGPNEEPAEGTFASLILYVSNQSFDLSPVDIKVSIDDKVAVDQSFAVGNQHQCKAFQLQLGPGKHKLHVESRNGNAVLDKEIEIRKKHWAVIDFWYVKTPNGSSHATPKKFTLDMQDEPIHFE